MRNQITTMGARGVGKTVAFMDRYGGNSKSISVDYASIEDRLAYSYTTQSMGADMLKGYWMDTREMRTLKQRRELHVIQRAASDTKRKRKRHRDMIKKIDGLIKEQLTVELLTRGA